MTDDSAAPGQDRLTLTREVTPLDQPAAGAPRWRISNETDVRYLHAGGDVRSLMQIMGWSSPRMVQRYVTYRPEHLAQALSRVA